ncbi:mitotic checkpoint regulator, MAD2B-interacting-domain-containing protein [Linnemannia elongata]|nr:mitotic checkpoint regulator, MAD2B-interacting-domain-containing protein [Linnemannia elongata]
MDALAAYGSDSDDSGSESGHITTSHTTKQTTLTSTTQLGSKISSLSCLLPPPKSAGGSAAGQAKVSKYSSMPTLEDGSDSEEEESEFRKKARLAAAANSGGAGGVGALFAMLPAPKNTPPVTGGGGGSKQAAAAKPTGFMPRTVKKPTPAVVKKPAPTVVDEKDEKDHSEDDDDDDDDEGPVSFFPLGSAATGSSASASASGSGSSTKPAASSSYIPLFFDKRPLTTEEQQAQTATYVDVSASNEQYAYPSNDQYAYPTNDQYAYPTNDQYAYPTNDQYAYATNEAYTGAQYAESSTSGSSTGGRGSNMIELDDVGLQKLGMRKARDAPINVIDVYAKDQMGQAQQVRATMGTSSQTQPKPVDLASIEHLKPTAGQKRKHNIMSLAYQAKANQHQLSASWASSRQTKAETQSKYGF